MSFVEVVFGIVLAAFSARVKGHVTDDDRMRLHAVSNDIWAAAEAAQTPPFRGEAGKEATAIALTAIAQHESGFMAKVQDCSLCYIGSKWCDEGRSVSLYQLRQGSSSWGQYTREELCTDNTKATERALAVLVRNRHAHMSVKLFDGYARGGITIMRPTQAAIEIDSIFATFAKKAGLRVVYRDNALHAVWTAKKPQTSVMP